METGAILIKNREGNPNPMSRILVLEPNPYHYVTIPGLCYYFDQLGYSIDCMVQKHDLFGDEFCKAGELKNRINYIFYDKQDLLTKLSQLTQDTEYDYIVLNSFDYAKDGKIHSIYADIKDISKSKYGIIGFYHSLSSYYDNQETDKELAEEKRIFALTPISDTSISFPMLSASYLKDTSTNIHSANGRTIISIGISNDDAVLRKAASTVTDKTKEPTVIFVGYKTKKELFIAQIKRIIAAIISKLVKSYSTSKKPYPYFTLAFKKNMRLYSKVSFDTMFNLIEESDFIAINLKSHLIDEFSTCRTTGSKLLALGFGKPAIIEERCAAYYGFSEDNCILYKEGHMDEAVQKACSLSDEEYSKMQKSMIALQEQVCKESLDALKSMLSAIENK